VHQQKQKKKLNKMKTNLFLLFGIFFITNSFAHKDKQIHKKYGNVKIYMKTGFEYSDISKLKVIGKLSKKISEHLKYKDTIFIEYIQDYTNKYLNDIYLLENNNSNYRFISGIPSINENAIKSNNEGISIRVYADKINIQNILKLVEYAIVNNEKLNSHFLKQKVQLIDKGFEYSHFKTIANSNKFIEKIFGTKTSTFLKSIINKKTDIELQEQSGNEIYWKNNEFLFEYKYLKWLKKENRLFYKIKDYYYHINIGYGNRILVFIDKTHFYYVDPKNKLNNKQNEFKNGTYVPARVIGKFKNKLLIFNYYGSSDFSMYLIKQNKMITEFE
jgi:hypothetical protein